MEDDTLKDKEQEELRALLDKPDESAFSDEENQDNESSQDEDKTSAEGEDGNSDDTASKNDDDNSEDNSDSDENKDKTKNEATSSDEDQNKESKDHWHGKSREEVIKAYESLKTRVAALENKKTDKDDNPADEKAESSESKDDNPEIPPADELQKMTPTDFAKWVLERIDEGVKRTIETQEKIRGAVRQEISDAKKEHPLQDPDYRKMVLAIIDAASAKGTTIPLKEACSQVDAFLGKHKGESEDLSNEEKSRLKKAKAQVESGAGAPTQPDGSDAETIRIQKALAGSGSRSPLGGLGI